MSDSGRIGCLLLGAKRMSSRGRFSFICMPSASLGRSNERDFHLLMRCTVPLPTVDTTTPAGKLMFQVCGAFAEFERSMIRQRVNTGLKRAVAQGFLHRV
jgi:hypothetical protein